MANSKPDRTSNHEEERPSADEVRQLNLGLNVWGPGALAVVVLIWGLATDNVGVTAAAALGLLIAGGFWLLLSGKRKRAKR